MAVLPRWLSSRSARTAVAAGLAVLGCLLVWAAWARPTQPDLGRADPPIATTVPASTPRPAEPSRKPSAPSAEADVRDRTKGRFLPESDPVHVSIPRIRAESRLIHLGLDDQGAMEVPKDPADAGWYDRGASPGALGPAVIAGHVAWNRTPGVFLRLRDMRRGDEVLVTRRDGRVAVFTVTRVSRHAKTDFPTEAVYGPIDHAGLRLITCGGAYDSAGRTYLDNVVVFARMTDVRKARG
jgi:sortase (surface protein transpeptidase)